MKIKRITLLIIALCIKSCLLAQESYDPLRIYNKGRQWEYSVMDKDRRYVGIDNFEFAGRDNIDGKEYHILLFYREPLIQDNTSEIFFPPQKGTTIHIREADGCVFVPKNEYLALLSDNSYWHLVGDSIYIPYKENDDGELMLYDFNMHCGDSYRKVEGHPDITVIAEDYLITEDGVSRHRMMLSNGMEIIEGLGCTNSCGSLLFYLNPTQNAIIKWEFLELVWDDMSPASIYTVPQEDKDQQIAHIYHPKSTKSNYSFLYSLQGVVTNSFRQKGIYIHNGKKYLIK